MRIAAAGFGVTGAGREKNDDYYCLGPFVEQGVLTSLEIDTTSSSFRRYGFLAAVADGMGGYAGGNVASHILLEYLSARFYSEERGDFSDEALLSSLQRYLEEAQQALVTELQRSPALQQAGTTLAGIVLTAPDRLIVFHIGDSRVLRFAAGYLRPLTIDHSFLELACPTTPTPSISHPHTLLDDPIFTDFAQSKAWSILLKTFSLEFPNG